MTSYQRLSQFRRNDSLSLSDHIRFALWFFSGRLLLASFLPGSFWRKQILRLFGAKIGSGGRFKPRLHITCPWNLVVGSHCWSGESSWIDNLAQVNIGDNVRLSQGAYLCTGNHDYRAEAFDLQLAPICVDSFAWVAAKATVAPGVTIGKYAIVSLGSVVFSDIPDSSIVKGNPAIIVGTR